MGVQSARSLTPHKRRRAVALASGHYESIIMAAGIIPAVKMNETTTDGEIHAAENTLKCPSLAKSGCSEPPPTMTALER